MSTTGQPYRGVFSVSVYDGDAVTLQYEDEDVAATVLRTRPHPLELRAYRAALERLAEVLNAAPPAHTPQPTARERERDYARGLAHGIEVGEGMARGAVILVLAAQARRWRGTDGETALERFRADLERLEWLERTPAT
jgi:hypothetical protein